MSENERMEHERMEHDVEQIAIASDQKGGTTISGASL